MNDKMKQMEREAGNHVESLLLLYEPDKIAISFDAYEWEQLESLLLLQQTEKWPLEKDAYE